MDIADYVGVESLVEIASEMVWILTEDGEGLVARPCGYETRVCNEDVETSGGNGRGRCGCFLGMGLVDGSGRVARYLPLKNHSC
jgi:hypothetical protein